MDWDKRYSSSNDYVFGKEPIRFLLNHEQLLPALGKALDVAMGEGRNAVYLARLGLEVTGIDISGTGVKKALKLAKDSNVVINAITANLENYVFKENTYNLIVCFNYLDRNMIPSLKKALIPNGQVFMETYKQGQEKYIFGPSNVDHLLKPGELKELFAADMKILFYEELDNKQQGAKAGIVAMKPQS